MERTTFQASPNFKLFAGRDADSLFLYREKSPLWRKALPATNTRLLGLANNGLLLVQTGENLLTYDISGEDAGRPIEPYSSGLLASQGITLGPVLLEELGGGLIVEKRSAKITAPAESFFSFFKKGKPQAPGSRELFELVSYEFASGSEQPVWKFTADRGNGNLLWASTRDLEYMIVAERNGADTRMLLFEPKKGKSVYEVSLADTRVEDLHINGSGTVMARIEGDGEVQYVGIKNSGEKFFVNPPKAELHVVHLGAGIVLMKENAAPVFYLKSFDDNPLLTLDLGVLEQIDQDYHLFFRPNDDPVLVGLEKDSRTLQLIYTSLAHLEIQYKSWQLEARNRSEAPPVSEKEKEEEEAARRREEMLAARSRVLSLAIPEVPQPAPAATEDDAQPSPLQQEESGPPPAVPSPAAETEPASTPARPTEISIEEVMMAAPEATPATAAEPDAKERSAEIPLLEVHPESASPPAVPAKGKKKKKKKTPDATEIKQEAAGEMKRIQGLIEKLEERFINGEISEKAYYELKEKYEAKLREFS